MAVSSAATSKGAGSSPPLERRTMSFLKANTMSETSRMIPTTLAISRVRSERGRRVTVSTAAWAMWPPSSTGMGKRFMSPRFTLMKAMRSEEASPSPAPPPPRSS